MYKMLETVESAVSFTVCSSVRKTLTMPFDIVNPLLIYTVGEVLGHLFVMKDSLGPGWLKWWDSMMNVGVSSCDPKQYHPK